MTSADLKKAVYRYRWIIFIILTVAYFFVYFHRISVGVVGRGIVDDVGGSIGLLSSVYFWTYTAMQIPSGLLADHLGPRKATFIFLSVAAAGSFLTCLGTEFWEIVLGKMLIAAGMAVIYIPLMKIISVWFSKADFPLLTGIVIAVGNVGAIAATAPLKMLADALGWREVFLILGLVTLILALLCLSFVRDHPHKKGLPAIEEIESQEKGTPVEDPTDAKLPMIKGLIMVASGGRKFWTMALAYFLVYGSIMVFQGTWAVTYFEEVYGYANNAAWLISVLGIGKILSTVAIGVMNGRGIIKSKRTAMIWGTLMFTATWGLIWVFAGSLDNYGFWLVTCFLFGFFGGFMTLSFTQVKEWYPTAISGTSVSAMNLFLFLGASVFTTITGVMIGTSYTIENFTAVWALMFAMSIAALAMVVLSVEKRKDDPFVGSEKYKI
ncbi:MAG: MFS transporter [Methanomassiliicoccaceae archaeon]|nr:MFS transporter [Methanomassiliicoccaceae archaeon]